MTKEATEIGKRLLLIKDKKGFKKIGDFCKATGIASPVVSKLIHDKNKTLNMDQFKKLIKTFDDINHKWLIWGEGQPFFSKTEINQSTENNNGTIIGISNTDADAKKDVEISSLNKKILELETKLESANLFNNKLLAMIESKL